MNSKLPRKSKPLTPAQQQEVVKIVRRGARRKGELKFFNSDINGTAITTTATITQISPIPQGVSDTDRVGDSLDYVSLEVRYTVNVGDPTNIVRVLFYQWFPSATTPIIADFLLPGSGGTTQQFDSLDSHDYRTQFHKIHDNLIVCCGNGTANFPITTNSIQSFRFKVSNFRKKVQFVGGTTSGDNQLYIVYLCDSAILPNPSIRMTCKILYTDA